MQRSEDYNVNLPNFSTNSEKFRINPFNGYETLQNVNAESPIRISLRMCSFIGYSQTTQTYAKILTFRRLLKTLQTIYVFENMTLTIGSYLPSST